MLVSKSYFTACTLAAALSVAASPAGAANASVDINNAHFELIDLDLNDNVVPWLQLGYRDDAMGAYFNKDQEVQERFWHGSVTLGRPYGAATALVSGTKVQSSARIWDGPQAAGANFSSVGSQWFMFELSPNTQLKLSATVVLQADHALGETSRAQANFYGYFSSFDQTTPGEHFEDRVQNLAGTRIAHYVGTLSTGPSSAHGIIGYSTFTEVQGVAAPVPEPENYAMLLAGLAAIGGYRLRRRRRPA
ncbi:MAG TPA: PEP-CTERM sorting domain-containing protein [Telluria sp.]|jgi:hypothetical protein